MGGTTASPTRAGGEAISVTVNLRRSDFSASRHDESHSPVWHTAWLYGLIVGVPTLGIFFANLNARGWPSALLSLALLGAIPLHRYGSRLLSFIASQARLRRGDGPRYLGRKEYLFTPDAIRFRDEDHSLLDAWPTQELRVTRDHILFRGSLNVILPRRDFATGDDFEATARQLQAWQQQASHVHPDPAELPDEGIAFVLTESDIRDAASLLKAPPSQHSGMVGMGITSLAIGGFACLAYGLEFITPVAALVAVIAGGILSYMFWSFWHAYRWAVGDAATRRVSSGPQAVSTSVEGIQVARPPREMAMPWRTVLKVSSNASVCVFVGAGDFHIVVPAHAFDEESAFEAFIEASRQYLSGARSATS